MTEESTTPDLVERVRGLVGDVARNVELIRAGYEEFNKTGQPPMQIYDSAIEWPV
jgi:hypothetical protein